MADKNEMVTFDQAIQLKGRKAIDFFSNQENLTPLIEFVQKEANSVVPDVKTKKGRTAIGSTARKVSQSRKLLTDAIDSSVSEMEAKVKVAKQSSEYVTEELNQTRDAVLEIRKTWQAEQDLIEEFLDLHKPIADAVLATSQPSDLFSTTFNEKEIYSRIETIDDGMPDA